MIAGDTDDGLFEEKKQTINWQQMNFTQMKFL